MFIVDVASIRDVESLEKLCGFSGHGRVKVICCPGYGTGSDLVLGSADSEVMQVSEIEGGEIVGSRGIFFPSQYVRMADATSPADAEKDRTRISYLLAGYALNSADVLVTEEPSLLSNPLEFLNAANARSPKEALALLGLFLRLNDDFTLSRTHGPPPKSFNVNRGLFYWGLARSLLPASWRWFSACVTSGAPDLHQGATLFLAEATLRRVDKALRARDRMWEQCQREPSNDTADEIVFYFEQLLMLLMGAFDALARVTNQVHRPQTSKGKDFNDHQISWRKDDWRSALLLKNQALATAMAKEAKWRDALEFVALLRNMVHGEGLRSVVAVTGWKKDSIQILVPEEEKADLLAAALRRGGPDRWGIKGDGGGMVLLAPHLYVESLLPATLEAIDGIMNLTPVEQLPNVDPNKIMTGPLNDDAAFDPKVAQAMRLLAGL